MVGHQSDEFDNWRKQSELHSKSQRGKHCCRWRRTTRLTPAQRTQYLPQARWPGLCADATFTVGVAARTSTAGAGVVYSTTVGANATKGHCMRKLVVRCNRCGMKLTATCEIRMKLVAPQNLSRCMSCVSRRTAQSHGLVAATKPNSTAPAFQATAE